MTVARSERTYPLALTADSLNTGIVSAFDWAAEDGSTATSNGKDHSGNNRHFTPVGAGATIVQTAVGKGRDTSIGRTVFNSFYEAPGPATIGMAVGTGDFTWYKRIRTPTVTPTATTLHPISRIADSAGNKMVVYLYEVLSTTAWHWQVSVGTTNTNVFLWNQSGATGLAIPPNTDSMLHITRTAGVLKFFINGVLKGTVNGNTTDFLSTTGASKPVIGNYTTAKPDAVHIDDIFWSRGLTDSEVAAHAANPYGYYAYSTTPDAVVVTAPTSGASVSGASFAVTGTYSGGTSVTSVDASFNGGAYVTISASPSGGAFSGAMTGQTPGNGTLTVRTKNGAAVVASTTVSNLTVVGDAIAFDVEDDSIPLRSAPYKMFQRDGANQASVRIKGTYTGTPTAIQYRWASGAWTTLVASPSGGVFDQTVTLQGPNQGDLSIRFSNSTGIVATQVYVGVGDVFLVAGQSNHVGKSSVYVAPVAPASNPTWRSVKRGKDGVWKLHEETASAKFDGETSVYSVNQDPTPQGSYFGALATKIMAGGVPVAFVPVAKGSTSLSAWAVNTATTSLYGAALAVAAKLAGYRAVLWWQGENETQTTTTQAAHVSALNTVINDWFSRTGKKWFIWAINAAGNGSNFQAIHDALIEVGQTNANVQGLADLDGSFTGDVHYDTSAEIAEIANRTFSSLNLAYTYDNVKTVVGAEMAGGYSLSGRVTTDLAASYGIGGLVGAELAGSYFIDDSLTAVGANFSGAYSIKSLAGVNLSGTYEITAPISASFTPSTSRTVTVNVGDKPFAATNAWSLAEPKKPKITKDTDATLDYTFNWAPWLTDSADSILSHEIIVTEGLEVESSTVNGATVTVFVSGGTPAKRASITCRITTRSTPPRKEDRTIYLDIEAT